jgi:RHS repeat-associated protein
MFKKIFLAAWAAMMFACCQLAAAATSVSVSATPTNPTAPANIVLSISVNPDPDPVTITQVEYFNGSTSLGVVASAPYSLAMSNVAAGTYAIVARASTTDPNNPVLQSEPHQVTVAAAAGSATAYFIHTDQLNTPRAITNGSGALVWRWDSDPFGQDAANEQPAGQGAFEFNQRFPGQQFDRESNLHYNYFRDYDPQTGRYIQSDPIGLHGGVNTFGYAGSNPQSYIDPDGKFFFLAFAGPSVAAAIGDFAIVGGLVWTANKASKQQESNNVDPVDPMASVKEDRKASHAAYKEYQRKGYQRDPNDPCQELRNRIAYLERLIADRTMHDARFPNPGYPLGRHTDVNAADQANVNRLKERLRNECPDQCK